VVFGLALVVRLVSLAEIAPSPLAACPAPDSEYYIHIGAELREMGLWSGGDFLINPLYTILVGWLKPLIALTGIRLLQVVLGALSAWLIYRIGARVFDERAGVIAGVAYALYPMAILFTLALLPTTIAMAGCAGAALLALRTAPRGGMAPALAVGLLLGLTTLARPNLLLWAGAFVVWYWLVAPRAGRWKPVLLLILGVALPLLVNTARNYSVSGEPILIASNGGINFYFGNHPGVSAAFSIPRGFPDTPLEQLAAARKQAEAETGRELGPSAVSRHWFNRGCEYLAAQPGRAVLLWARKAALMFNARELPINEGLVEYGHFSRLLAIPLPWYGLMIPLSLTGLFFTTLGRESRPGLWLLLLILAAHIAGLVPFFVSSRHRLPLLIALLPLTGMAVVELHRRWKEKESRGLTASVSPVGFTTTCYCDRFRYAIPNYVCCTHV
jgi:4-amino-4-deoxy-L-arabinose transferase-like glycosyltransferase